MGFKVPDTGRTAGDGAVKSSVDDEPDSGEDIENRVDDKFKLNFV